MAQVEGKEEAAALKARLEREREVHPKKDWDLILQKSVEKEEQKHDS